VNPSAEELRKSVYICRRYDQTSTALFFRHSVYIIRSSV